MNFDSKQLLFLPPLARALTLGVTLAVLAAALAVAVGMMGNGERADWILIAMSLAQIALAAFLFVVVAFFSSHDENIASLVERSNEFLERHMRQSLAKVTAPRHGLTELTVECLGASDIFGKSFRLSQGEFSYNIWVGLNVHRIFVIYYIAAGDRGPAYIDHLKEVFRFTFGGAESVNFKSHYEYAVEDGEPLVSIWLTVPASKDLLTDPAEKLFWAQDVAMMTESFLRTALRNNIDLKTKALAAPL